MDSQPNARLTQKSCLRLVTQHLEHGRSLVEQAEENGISLRCTYRWFARYRSGDAPCLKDHRSIRRSKGRTLVPQ
jgi:hypothetical protein